MAKVIPISQQRDREHLPIPRPADVAMVFTTAAENARAAIFGVMATVIARHGSAPSTPGQKMYLAANGTCIGTVGGGAIEREVLESCMVLVRARSDAHAVHTFKLGAELGMCCGGSVDVLIESIAARHPCLIVGGGHVATATAPLLARVGFAVTVVDAREGWSTNDLGAGVTCVHGEFDEVGKSISKEAAILVMTHDHALDQRVIEWALKCGFEYVGGIGSRAKAKRTSDRLEHKGFPESDRARVRMPIGVAVGARLPDEIAVAIAAEMVAWKRSRGRSTRDDDEKRE